MKSPLFSAIALLVGTVVGAGIFAIPQAVARAGWWASFLLLIGVGVIVYALHLAYGEIVLRTKRVWQLTGLADVYLGIWGKRLAAIAMFMGGYGALLAYIIGVGTFLQFLLSDILGGTVFWYSTGFFLLGSLVIYKGLNAVEAAQKVMFVLLMGVLVLILVAGAPVFSFEVLTSTEFSWRGVFALFGVLVFAYGGMNAIVDMERVLKDDLRKMRVAMLWAFALIGAVYLLFSFMVVGISGTGTTSQAVDGLVSSVGSWVLVVGALFGALTMTGSFLISGLVLRETMELDYGMKKIPSWLLAVGVPYVFYLFGVQDFSRVIEFVGAVATGGLVVLILMMHQRAKRMGDDVPVYEVRFPFFVRVALYVLFGLGIVYQLSTVFVPSLFV